MTAGRGSAKGGSYARRRRTLFTSQPPLPPPRPRLPPLVPRSQSGPRHPRRGHGCAEGRRRPAEGHSRRRRAGRPDARGPSCAQRAAAPGRPTAPSGAGSDAPRAAPGGGSVGGGGLPAERAPWRARSRPVRVPSPGDWPGLAPPRVGSRPPGSRPGRPTLSAAAAVPGGPASAVPYLGPVARERQERVAMGTGGLWAVSGGAGGEALPQERGVELPGAGCPSSPGTGRGAPRGGAPISRDGVRNSPERGAGLPGAWCRVPWRGAEFCGGVQSSAQQDPQPFCPCLFPGLQFRAELALVTACGLGHGFLGVHKLAVLRTNRQGHGSIYGRGGECLVLFLLRICTRWYRGAVVA